MEYNSLEKLSKNLEAAKIEISKCIDIRSVESIRISWLGKKGCLTQEFSKMQGLPPQDRAVFGQNLNKIKVSLTGTLSKKKSELEDDIVASKLRVESLDMTLPAFIHPTGALHVIPQTIEEVMSIFGYMGFAREEGPDIEDDFHNFTALNFPKNHPARDTQDTFFIEPPVRSNNNSDKDIPKNNLSSKKQVKDFNHLLRTHTSPVQVRTMLSQKPPIRIITLGRCYRRDSDITHSPMFHQVEGLYIDKKVSFGNLKFCLSTFLKQYFSLTNVPLRFRPSFFPFTEPSAEVDIACKRQGDQLRLGEGDDWLEILGSGMVHPNVLKTCGIDPEEYTGFAFGMGLERISMLKYGISDLRAFYEGDFSWLNNFGFSPFFHPDTIKGLVA